MKQNLFVYLFVFLLGTGTLSVQAQSLTMNIIQWSGEDTAVEAAAFDKITFTDDDLVVNYTDGNTQSIDMLSIRKITFSGNFTDMNDINAEEIYVSFDANQLILNNLPEGINNITIYSVSGTVIQNTIAHFNSPSVDITHLDKGAYIVKINNQAIKFVRP